MTTLNMSQKELNGLYLPDPTKIEGKDDYKNNTRLRPRGMSFAYTPEHIEEYARCADPETGLEYFLSKYYKIETSDGDLIQYDPFPYQTDFAKKSIKHRLVLMLSSRQSGKCVHVNTRITLRNPKNGYEFETTIGELYSKLEAEESPLCLTKNSDKISRKIPAWNGLQRKSRKNHADLSNVLERKFTDSYQLDLNSLEVWSDSGCVPVTHLHRTVEYEEYELKTENHSLTCADDHIVFTTDGSQIFVKDLVAGVTILTKNGVESVLWVKKNGLSSQMFDLTVDSDEHRLYTDGILSHNTTGIVGVLLWNLIFNRRYNIAITANKLSQAIEILDRIKIAYEWVHFGCNKASLDGWELV